MPVKSFNLAAFVSEPVKPLIDVIVNCPDLGVYLNQSDKGELVIGGAPDSGQSFRRDVKQTVFEDAVVTMLELFPAFRRLKLLRQWGGVLDIAHDAARSSQQQTFPDYLYLAAGGVVSKRFQQVDTHSLTSLPQVNRMTLPRHLL